MKRVETIDNLISAIAPDLEPIVEKASPNRKDRPYIELNEQEEKDFNSFCAANTIFKQVRGTNDAAKEVIKPVIFKKLMEQWIDEGCVSDNPVIQTKEAQANFEVRNVIKVNVSEDANGNFGSIQNRLMEVGFEEEEAEKFCSTEIKEYIDTNFHDLKDLRNGSAAQQKAVSKLLKLVLANFTQEEQRLLVKKEKKVEVEKDFLKRSINYCDGSFEKLDALFSVLAPQLALTHVTYSGKDLNSAVQNLTGNPSIKSAEFYSPDNIWKAIAQGVEASLYKNDKLVANTTCKGGHEHAKMTCKKWLREPEYRDAGIAKFKK